MTSEELEGAVKEPGLYKHNDTVYKVVRNQEGTRLWASRLVMSTEKAGLSHHFRYERGAVSQIKAKDRLTPEEAKEFGDQFKSCINCGRPLSRNESLHRGYGPTCADNEGWPYDHNAD